MIGASVWTKTKRASGAEPSSAAFGKLILGMSGQGVDILVPKTMYEDAVALCNEEGVVEDD